MMMVFWVANSYDNGYVGWQTLMIMVILGGKPL